MFSLNSVQCQCSASECNKATEQKLVIIYQNDSGSPFHHVSPILALPPGRSQYACLDGVGVEQSGVVRCGVTDCTVTGPVGAPTTTNGCPVLGNLGKSRHKSKC